MKPGDLVEINDRKFIFFCSDGDMKDGSAKKLLINDDIEAAIFFVKGKYYALNNECPHNHLRKIHNGFVAKQTVACPMHGWTYSLITGENVKGGASLESYNVEIIDQKVYVEVPKPKRPKWMDSY
jgi:nitrite reductase/ring-hydroxylating ferredoxin subunit